MLNPSLFSQALHLLLTVISKHSWVKSGRGREDSSSGPSGYKLDNLRTGFKMGEIKFIRHKRMATCQAYCRQGGLV